MLKVEFDTRYASARANYMDRAYVDGVKQIFTMENCPCGNAQELWMFALDSYDARPGAANILTTRQVHCLLCRMEAENKQIASFVPAPPSPPDPPDPPPVILFTFSWAWMDNDPYAALLLADNLVYQGSAQTTPGSMLNADLRAMPPNQYHVIRYPVTESDKTEWIHDIFNYGTLPDQNYRAVFTAHGYKYIVSRQALTFGATELTKFF